MATGIGKTRLMASMIVLLYLEFGITNFMILAPNLTIYEKLIHDFTPNSEKYLFKGILDFEEKLPQIITGDTYEKTATVFRKNNQIQINIFNISKINSEKDEFGIPKIHRFSEYIGQSYFEYLSNLKNLIIFMDEAHHYHAKAGIEAIDNLNPRLGVELTATAMFSGNKNRPLNNIIYNYSLKEAIEKQYLKIPTIVGQENFKKELYTEDTLEDLKIKDALIIHERIKSELQIYSEENKKTLIKPLMLVIAESIPHSEKLYKKITKETNDKYSHKILVLHSKQDQKLKEENLKKLQTIEENTNPFEIIIHVNKLNEGWDVKNIYTLLPLRAANSMILIEQSMGRGLRLPFGQRTGNKSLDQLNIINHDKFNELITKFKQYNLNYNEEYLDHEQNIKLLSKNTSLSIQIPLLIEFWTQQKELTYNLFNIDYKDFQNYHYQKRDIIILEIPNLKKTSIESEKISIDPNLEKVLLRNLKNYIEINYEKDIDLLIKLVQQVITYISSYSKDHSETEWIINYYQKEISEKIYQQIMKNLIKPSIKREIKIKGEIQTSSIPYYLTAQKGLKDINYKTIIEKKREIQNIVFSGFQKCCYQLQKFDSNPEKEFCEILEDSKGIISWLKINWDIGIKLNIKYEDPVTHNMKLYIPDFIIESKDYKYILEIKAKKDIFDLDVQSKKEAAERWCDFATTFEKRDEHYKSWRYILITDDFIKLDTTFSYIIEK